MKNKHSSVILKLGHLLDLWLSQPLRTYYKGKLLFYRKEKITSEANPTSTLDHVCLHIFLPRQEEEMGFYYYFQESPEASTTWIHNQAQSYTWKPTHVV